MSVFSSPGSGVIALVLLVALAALAALLSRNVKLRSASRRWLGFSVYDFGADLDVPSPLRSRSNQIAFYVTMKALPRENTAAPAKAAAGSPPSASGAPRAA
jgi:hypothetical protein